MAKNHIKYSLFNENKTMYAAIFRATIKELDARYSSVASRMRDLAIQKYGCTEFVSVTDGTQEISISYWQDQKQIEAWKQDSEHIAAQEFGKAVCYKSYTVQVVEILREYGTTSVEKQIEAHRHVK